MHKDQQPSKKTPGYELTMKFDEHEVKSSDYLKILGVTIENKLKFSNKTVIFARKWAIRLRLRTKGVSATLAIALLGNHGPTKQNPSSTANQGPKLERPKINVGVTAEEWNVFT